MTSTLPKKKKKHSIRFLFVGAVTNPHNYVYSSTRPGTSGGCSLRTAALLWPLGRTF